MSAGRMSADINSICVAAELTNMPDRPRKGGCDIFNLRGEFIFRPKTITRHHGNNSLARIPIAQRRILRTIIEKFEGGPVGLNTIGAAIGEDANTIEEVYEPFLVQHGFLQRTPRGRVATAQAYRHFGFTPQTPSTQESLF